METRATETIEPLPPEAGGQLLAAGTILGSRFELGPPLGWGGYAVVYAALDRQLQKRVALKVLRSERVTASAVARMRREVAVARDVSSPRLVKLYDIGEDGPHTFISMELIQGCSLRDLISRSEVPLDEALRISDQVLEALETLHEQGIVHRDLKPANILLTTEGEVKLVDFGLARHWENEEMRVTRTEGLVGTMEYLSPEQALGRNLDARSDLYSFGIVLYEMLTGRLPFGGASSLGSVVATVTTHAPDVRRSRADLPLWLSLLVCRLLEKNVDHRPASATQVREALREKKVDWTYRWKRSRARTTTLAVLAASVLAMGWIAWSSHMSAFDHISSDVSYTLHAWDRKGRVLWSRPNCAVGRRAAVVNVRPGETRVAVVPLDDDKVPDAGSAKTRPLIMLDPRTGEELARIPLPPPPPVFPFDPAFNLIEILPVDVDHDGADEIVATYIHFYWPSYSVLVDPRSTRSGIVLMASGHNRPLGTIDLDGDGVDEILFSGPNNRMGWRDGVAAVRPRVVADGEGGVIAANTPDAMYSDNTAALVWYTLLPRKRVYGTILENVDRERRTFDLVNDDESRVTLTFDGFLAGTGTPDDVAVRQSSRSRAYDLLREVQLKESLGELDRAVALGREAADAAAAAGEAELQDWISTTIARTLARSGRPAAETDAEIENILASTRGGPELCWEVARVFSQRGDSRRAADWYERALSLTSRAWTGHPPADYLTEAVISLVEIEQWDEALDLIDGFMAGFSEGHAEALRARALVLWRTGRAMSDEIPYTPGMHWLKRYWSLEYAWAMTHPDPAEFLQRVERELEGTESTPWVRSIEADVLFALGRTDEALPIIRRAWTSVTADPTDATARVHRAVIEERLRKIEAAALAASGNVSR